jgi:hypothetical protein
VRDNYTCGGTIGMLQHVMAAGHMVDEKSRHAAVPGSVAWR